MPISLSVDDCTERRKTISLLEDNCKERHKTDNVFRMSYSSVKFSFYKTHLVVGPKYIITIKSKHEVDHYNII